MRRPPRAKRTDAHLPYTTLFRSQGMGLRTRVPGHPAVLSRLGKAKPLRRYDALFGAPAAVLVAKLGELDLLVLDAPDFFAREGGPYGDAGGGEWPDNWKRFAEIGRAHV